jgi:Fic family protein
MINLAVFIHLIFHLSYMIEQAPPVERTEQVIALVLKLQNSGALQNIQDEYLYWDKIKYKAKDIKPLELWAAVKFFRYVRRKTIKFNDIKFHFVVTDYIQKSLHQFDMHIGGTLGSNIGIAETDKTKFIISSLTEEAISSSQMEGANTTRLKAKEMIQKEKKPKDKSEYMIFNNFITMKHIVQHKNEDLTIENLLYIHKLITNNTLEDSNSEGQFRNNDDVYVIDHNKSEVVHTPPRQHELKKLINDLCKFFNTDTKEFIHPIIKGCIIHFMIGWIHPFTDGNGRTARALFYWYMLKNGYWLTEYLSISRIIKDSKYQYEKAYLYTEIDENDLTYFITYHIKTMEKAFEALKSFISRKQKEVFQAAMFMKIPGVNDRMAQIIKLINEDPDRILNAKEIQGRFNVSNFTARTDLKSLVALGFLELIQVNKQKQNFIKSPTFHNVLRKYKL